jgi:uncharacterized Fe-S cluster-containing radical SAM superfamily protein
MKTHMLFRKLAVNTIASILVNFGDKLVQTEPLRRWMVQYIQNKLLAVVENSRSDPNTLPGVADDQAAIGMAIIGSVERGLAENLISKSSRRGLVNVFKEAVINENNNEIYTRFREQYNTSPPTFLAISPTKTCNLHCTGCYADSGATAEKLDWDIIDRMITEAATLWGARFFVFSGGEPLSLPARYFKLIEKHSNRAFIMFTNGTLINEKVSKRLAQAGNVLPAISVEGWKERTDERRGEGVFDKVLETMKILRRDGVPFGISLTGTRQNAEEILSDEFIEFFQQQGILYAWLFQYMPIGRSYSLDLLPTPKQRVWLWRRSWEIVSSSNVRGRFRNSVLHEGCLSAGWSRLGGYFYV